MKSKHFHFRNKIFSVELRKSLRQWGTAINLLDLTVFLLKRLYCRFSFLQRIESKQMFSEEELFIRTRSFHRRVYNKSEFKKDAMQHQIIQWKALVP